MGAIESMIRDFESENAILRAELASVRRCAKHQSELPRKTGMGSIAIAFCAGIACTVLCEYALLMLQ